MTDTDYIKIETYVNDHEKNRNIQLDKGLRVGFFQMAQKEDVKQGAA